ncbi:hypothetical protein [Aquisalimonas asiatica]|uniref:Uncharacterized protein n=1 Tax=Aquisalimonas asiatica TaxID=406100 RepID=A0A1H8SUT9_9GAMM|nr:hypothetical protein [Aquisalimonas asiatica]SEO82256.1 hypothetical protein SAMN04488052_103206 [Aquisalimonas asiatica]
MLAALGLAACAGQDRGDSVTADEESQRQAPLSVDEERVQTAAGETLAERASIPSQINVDADASFGASERILDAALSADGEWLAVTTSGAAHGAGWLKSLEEGHWYPAAFQYGGSVGLWQWSDESRYVAFILEGPAEGQTISIVDRNGLDETVKTTALPVDRCVADDDAQQTERPPYQEPLVWYDGRLLLEVESRRYLFDPAAGACQPVG